MSSKKKTDEEKLVPRAQELTDLIDYQEDAVVSRTVIKRKAGTVTLFAFDKGQGLSEHKRHLTHWSIYLTEKHR